jgi:hypothetical protein
MHQLQSRDKRPRNNEPPADTEPTHNLLPSTARSQPGDERLRNQKPPPQPELTHNSLSSIARSEPTIGEVAITTDDRQTSGNAGHSETPAFRCRFHTGHVAQKVCLQLWVSESSERC